jgi:photosystem II stability/assembly factor-like uncharacterized protein
MKCITKSLIFCPLLLIYSPKLTYAQSDFWQKLDLGSYYGVNSIGFDSSGNVLAGVDSFGVIGIRKSTDAGLHWYSVSQQDWPMVMYTAPNGVIYAGGLGVQRSTDNGEHWSAVGLQDLPVAIYSLGVDSAGTIYAGTNRTYIYRTTDNGSSWSKMKFFTSKRELTIYSIQVVSKTVLFATEYDLGVYVSRDGGKHWRRARLPGVFGLYGWWGWYITADSRGNLYVAADRYLGHRYMARFWRSANGGLSWTPTDATLPLDTTVRTIAVTPNGVIYAGTDNHGIYRSENNGHSWAAINSGLTSSLIYHLGISRSGYVFAACGDGFFRSAAPDTPLVGENRFSDVLSPAPLSFTLNQNYPNPFNPTTVIRYSLPHADHVTLQVFNVLGQLVRTLVNEVQSAGYKEVTFDASSIPTGVYFYRLQTGTFIETKKLLLIK